MKKNKKVFKKVFKKGKRGRPKGSKNKATLLKEAVDREKAANSEPVVKMPPPKVSQVIGYCPKCSMVISKLDLISKQTFRCCSCDKSGRLSILKKHIPADTDKPTTKKEYLEHTLNHKHNDPVPMNHELDPKDFKVIEQ